MSLPQLRIYRFNMNLTDPITFNVSGRFVSCLASSESFLIQLNSENPMEISAGLSFVNLPETVTQITISPKVGAASNPNVIQIVVGESEVRDARLQFLGTINLTPGTTIKPQSASVHAPLTDVALVANTNTQIFAADAAARCRRIRNLSATDAVRISTTSADLTVAMNKGELINPGEVLETFVYGALFARSAGTPTLNLTQETF